MYAALNSSLSYRLGTRVNVGAAYTLSRVRGNFDGENDTSGPASVTPRLYPEYREERWTYPTGDLIGDQRGPGVGQLPGSAEPASGHAEPRITIQCRLRHSVRRCGHDRSLAVRLTERSVRVLDSVWKATVAVANDSRRGP